MKFTEAEFREVTLHNEDKKLMLPHCFERRKEDGNEKTAGEGGGREEGLKKQVRAKERRKTKAEDRL